MNRRDLLKRAALSTLALQAQLKGFSVNQARAINALQLEPFVDSMLLPQLLPREELRMLPGQAVGKVPFYRVTMREIYAKMASRSFAHPAVELWAGSGGAAAGGSGVSGRVGSSGAIGCRHNIFSPSITACTAPGESFRSRAAWSICTVDARRQLTTDIQLIGTPPASHVSATTRIGRTQRCCGITTTRWERAG